MNQELVDAVYEAIEEYIDEHGIPPTHRIIADRCHISKGAVGTYLTHLEKQNRIEREFGMARGIRLVKEKSGQTSDQMPEQD
jgi:SOS-response transcriptional repressor LexA